MLNINVKKLLAERMWDLDTCADHEPNVVPVVFKDVTEDGSRWQVMYSLRPR